MAYVAFQSYSGKPYISGITELQIESHLCSFSSTLYATLDDKVAYKISQELHKPFWTNFHLAIQT